MGRRADRNGPVRDVHLEAQAGLVYLREPSLYELRVHVREVQIDMPCLRAHHLGDNGPGYHVAGGQFPVGMVVLHEQLAVYVAQKRSLAPHGLAQEKVRRGGKEQTGGMELDELHVPEPGPGPQAECHAVRRGHLRVRGHGIYLSPAPGGKHRGVRCDGDQLAVLENIGPATHSFADDKVHHHAEGIAFDRGEGAHLLRKHPDQLAPGGVSVGMEHALAGMSGLKRKGELCALAVELGPPFDELMDPPGAFLHKGADRFFIAQAVARLQRVLIMDAHLVLVAHGDGDASLGVLGGALGEHVLGNDDDVAVRGKLDGGPQARHPGPYNEKISMFDVHMFGLPLRFRRQSGRKCPYYRVF